MERSAIGRKRLEFALCLVFFVSGAAALIFETLWFRLAGLTFGNSVWASSMVLASFMGGIAVGNGLSVRFASRIRQPLRAYAIIETAIGVAGVGLVLLFPFFTTIFAPLFRPFLEQLAILNPLRLGLAFVLMLIPTTAMGASLPLLVRGLARSDESYGVLLGRLYGWNTLGAMAGALAGELYLIEIFGLRGTGFVAGALNLLAAGTAYAFARQGEPVEGAAEEKRGRNDWLMLAAAAIAGAILLALEVIWFRFILLFTPGTTVAFAVMLAVVLLGIALGGLLASWLFRFDDAADRWLTLAAIACGAVVAYQYATFLPPPEPERTPLSLFLNVCGMSLRLMLPASILSGVLFTLMGRRIERSDANPARATALLTLANTIGAMLGALLGAFVLLPAIGIEGSIFALSIAYAAIAIADLVREPARRPVRAAGIALFLAAFALFPFGLLRNFFIPLITEPYRRDGSQIVAVREGIAETVIYLRRDLWGEPYTYRLVTNGTSMSGTQFGARRYMSLFADLPLALHPAPRRALLISYGVATTAQALTDFDALRRIDVVDISPDVVEMSRLRRFEGQHPLDDPRVRVHLEDGRFFLLTTSERYDLITAEPPPPKLAGIVNLYTREYFDLIYDRLDEGGLATYWLPVYQMSNDDAKGIVAAFCGAFRDCTLWSGPAGELILMGSRGQRRVDAATLVAPWQNRRTAATLSSIGVEAPELLGTLFIGDAAFLRALTAKTKPLVDDFPLRLSPDPVDDFPSDFLTTLDVRANQRRFAASAWARQIWPPEWRQKTLDTFVYQNFLSAFFMGSTRAGQLAMQDEARFVLERSPYRVIPLILMKGDPAISEIAQRARERGHSDPLLMWTSGITALSERRYGEALSFLTQARKAAPKNVDVARAEELASAFAGQQREAAGSR